MTLQKSLNKWTTGLTVKIVESTNRFCLFELDVEHKSYHELVLDTYRSFGLGVLIHRTGNGHHFISPTVVSLHTWKDFHKALKHINSKCPMTTLRWIPNKYVNEESIWYKSDWYESSSSFVNSEKLSNLLNHIFGSEFFPHVEADPVFVRYPLP